MLKYKPDFSFMNTHKPDFSKMSKSKIAGYIWDYYKVPILISLVILSSLVSSIYKHVTAKEPVLDVIMINSTSSYDGDMGSNDFVSHLGLDPKEYGVQAYTSFRLGFDEKHYADDFNVIQTLIVRLTEGDIDVFGGTPQAFQEFAMEGYFSDLRSYFTEDELAALEPILVYTTERETGLTYPCGFSLGDSKWNKTYYYFSGDCQFGIMFNADQAATAKAFLTYAINY